MNFFAGELTSKNESAAQGKFNGSGLTTDNVRLVSASKGVGDAVKLGIRPQHLELDEKGPLHGTVSLVERLGTDTIVELLAADKMLFRFATSEACNLVIGQVANFSFDAEKVHIF